LRPAPRINDQLAVEGRLVHLRLFPPVQKQPVEIDWIEITPTGGNDKERQRWDFKDAADPTKPKPEARASRRPIDVFKKNGTKPRYE
jgi:hypothetical protein